MSTRNESDIIIETGMYTMALTNVTRVDTTKSRGCNHEKEDYPAYQWVGDISIKNRWFGTDVQGKFSTDHFFAESVENLEMKEILFISLGGNNQLYVPTLSDRTKPVLQAIQHQVIERILLNYLLQKESSHVHIAPLRVWEGACDHAVSRLMGVMIPAHETDLVKAQ